MILAPGDRKVHAGYALSVAAEVLPSSLPVPLPVPGKG